MAHQGSGIMPQQLQDEPVLRDSVMYLWRWFLELHSARGSGMNGASPITWRDLLDWQQVTATRLAAWEVRSIRAIDTEYLKKQG